jgi:hypothetical protein
MANEVYEQGTGIINGFNIANETAAAKLEKAKKTITELKQELGEKLMPVMIGIMNGTASFTKFLMENSGALLTLAGAYAVVLAIKNKNLIVDGLTLIGKKAELAAEKVLHTIKLATIAIKRRALASELQETAAKLKNTAATEMQKLAEMKLRLEKLSGIAADNQMRAVLAQETIVKSANTAATNAQTVAEQAATKAIHAKKAAMMSMPWTAIVMAIAAIGVGLYKWATHLTVAEKAMKEFREESAKQEAQAKFLFDALKKVEKGSKEYHDILTKLKELYPDIINGMINEQGELKNINDAYLAVTKSIREKIAAQLQEKAVTDIIETSIKRQKQLYDSLRLQLEKRMGADVADVIVGHISEGIENGNIADVLSKLKKKFPEAELWKVQHVIDIIVKDIAQMNANVEKTNKSFGNIVPKKALTELELMNLELQELNLQLQLAETKSDKKAILEDIRLLKEKIELKKKEKAVVSPTGESGGSGSPNNKEADAWQKLNEQILKLQDDRRKAQLIGFEKERDQINSQYNKLIEEAKKFGEKGKQLAAQLETEKGEAVIEAGKKYLEKYTEEAKKFQEEIIKLAEKTAPTSQESKFVNDLFGSEKEWQEKVNSIAIHFDALEEMYNNATSETEKADVKAKMEQIYDAKLEAEYQFQMAKVNIIKKYTEETTQFVEDSADKQYLASLSNKERENVLFERQKQEAKERYDLEIKKTEELIAIKQKQKNVNQEEIKQLEDLLVKLKQLKENSDIEVKVKVESEGNVWEQLTKIDWDNFAENWQENMSKMAAAGQELADSMFQIWNSINQIAINNLQKELNAFKKAKDKELNIFNSAQKTKKKGLDDQIKKGIISQEYYNAQIEKMEEEKAAKEKQLAEEKEAMELAMKKEQFRREKQAAIIQAIIQGGLAVMATIAQWGLPWGLIPAAIATAMTIAQVALISSQPDPYKLGGFTGKKKNRLIQVNEEGEEWIASNKLLQDKKTAPIIGALEQYQQGKKSMLDNMYVSTPNENNLSQAASNISNNFTSKTTERIIERYYETSGGSTNLANYDEITAAMNKLNTFLENNKTLNAVISRKMQFEVDKQDEFLKKLAKI